MQIPVKIPGAPPVIFEVNAQGRGKPVFVMGIRKCGSTMLNQICRALANLNSVNFVDVAGTFFQHNIAVGGWVRNESVRKLLRSGNVYAGFRNMPWCLQDTTPFINARKIFLVRDPRDALVSEYFSNAYSHQIPDAKDDYAGARGQLLVQRKKALESPIDAYVRERARLMLRTFLEYRSIYEDPSALKLKYENIVFDKRGMISDIVAYLKWTCAEPAVAKILDRFDVRPEVEDQTSFIRKVTPGDHKEKLSAETISFLNRELAEALEIYGYNA
jgi:hypothetical protein